MAASSKTSKKAASKESTEDTAAATETETEAPASEAAAETEQAPEGDAPADSADSGDAPAGELDSTEDTAPTATVSGDTAGVQGNPDPDAQPKIADDVAATENPDGSARVGSAPLGWEGGPAAADLSAPKAKIETDAEGRQKLPTATDAAVESLRVAETQPYLTDENNQPVDPDSVFGEPNQWGQRRALVRLHLHTTATPHQRAATTVFLAKGKTLTKAQAEVVINRLKAQAERA